MRKQTSFLIAVLFILFLLLSSSTTSALTIDLIGFGDSDWGAGNSPGILGQRADWAEVAEMENVNTDSRINASNYYVYSPGGVMWIWGSPGYAQTTFTTPSTSLFVQFMSDSNDGLADFYIDGLKQYTLNTYNGSWFAVMFSDLNFASHTLKVVATTSSDLAIDAMGAGAPSAPVPEPTTMLLLGSGLIGLAGIGRKKISNAFPMHRRK